MHRRVLRMDAGFSMGTLQWLISCKTAVGRLPTLPLSDSTRYAAIC